ncbi:MAG: cystathionine gamma-lyase [Pseudomonadota bacterium]
MADPSSVTPIDARLLRLLHHRRAHLERGDPVGLPITHTSAYHLPGSPDAAYTYTRDGNPTWRAVETQISILEDAPSALFPSGMAAAAAILFTVLKPGDRLVLPSDGYFVVRALVQERLVPFGIEAIEWPTADAANAPIDGAKLVWLETPSNPGLDVCDIAEIARRTHAAGGLVAVDNTTMTPLLQSPLDLGADVVMVADTKAMSGHGDVLMGHVASRDQALMSEILRWRKLSGSIPGPAEAALVHRGIETLDVRLNRMCDTAELIAHRLDDHDRVKTVHFPGKLTGPIRAVAAAQMRRFGFLIGADLGTAKAADAFLSHCTAIFPATSFGSAHTSGERRARWGDDVPEGYVRLSIGCEPAEALWSAFNEALSEL